MRHHYKLVEVSQITGVSASLIIQYIEQEWITPAYNDPTGGEPELDDGDLARVRFIYELMKDFEVNSSSIPIILHLVDELNSVQKTMRARMAG